MAMVTNLLFIVGLGVFLSLLSIWGFHFLPHERWQVLGTIPIAKTADGQWQGLNLTYYGVFNGVAIVMAVAIMLVMLGSTAMPLSGAVAFITLTLALAGPAAKIVARIVEKKPCTLTVGGASFVGILAAPWIALAIRALFRHWALPPFEVMVIMAAVSTAYAFGEGLGRLSCISFGCCYGRPVSALPRRLQFVFRRLNFVFQGKTKKIAYAHALDGHQVLPVQALTAVIYYLAGLLGTWLFLTGHFTAAFLVTLATTQIWRVVSEFLRADYRGTGRLSVYQWMAFISVVYAVGIAWWFAAPAPAAVAIQQGLKVLWDPPVILFLQGLFLAVFLFTGRSKIITAQLTFRIKAENI
jgi:hypothetical protein